HYIEGVISQWLLIAPKANPAMLEMFRDRDASPLRQMVPWAGEFAGKYLTGAVQVLRVTGDPALRTWLAEFVDMLISGQAKDGYLGPWSEKHRLTNDNVAGERTWDTWGHYHIMLGMLLWHEESGDKKALRSAIRIGDLLVKKYLGQKRHRLVDTGFTEMNLAPVHSLCLLYKETGDESYLNLALQLVEEFSAQDRKGPLAGDYLQQALNGVPFYQMPKPRWESLHPIMAFAELYDITGEEKYRTAFENIWWSIVAYDRHNNGGFSSGEKATGDPYDFSAIETCCTIAWMALSVEMLKLTENAVVADELELSTVNAVVGMFSPTGRWSTYNTPMNGVHRASAHQIVFQAREGSPELNCCSVNAPRGFGLLSEWAVRQDDAGVWLNYYGPSEISVRLNAGPVVTFTQETSYPEDGEIDLRVNAARSTSFALRLRIPQWSRHTVITLNGESIPAIRPGSYLVIERTWGHRDHIHISLDMHLHYWAGEKACAGLTSIYRGPVLLAYDHRYNLELAAKGKPQIRDIESWDSRTCMLDVPRLNALTLEVHSTDWKDWLPPWMLFEVTNDSGERVRLCDFASAGQTGTPYVSWLPVDNAPFRAFTNDKPLKTVQME
ncbi:MAG: glycoside hydrolase family 127 protein, partial [Anaerolineae bacterium]|nr:glycoside hydrolase family 127 protein [Anaerolineae bacterium]